MNCPNCQSTNHPIISEEKPVTSYCPDCGEDTDDDDHVSELADLKRWKREAMLVLSEWEAVWVAAGSPGTPGQSKAAAVRKLLENVRPLAPADNQTPTQNGTL